MVESQFIGRSTSEARAQLFARFAEALRFPSPNTLRGVALGAFAGDVTSGLFALGIHTRAVEGLHCAPERLAEAYTRLFDVGGPGQAPVWLYGGEHGGGRMGTLAEIVRYLQFFGLRMSDTARERPDHLALQLELIHWLASQEAVTSDPAKVVGFRRAQHDLLTKHVIPLTSAISTLLASSDEPFYPSLLSLLVDVCQSETLRLQHSDPEAQPNGRSASGLVAGLSWLQEDGEAGDPAGYDLRSLRRLPVRWDRVVKATHLTSCTLQRSCNINLFVARGVVLREEQAANYPAPNDPNAPDANPRGCQKGLSYLQRMYDVTRLKYPLKRIGERGEGRWKRVSWDEALDEIADRTIDVLMREGPDAIIPGGGTHVHSVASDGMGIVALFEALGIPLAASNTEIGDDHQGAAVTLGKAVFSDSPLNWMDADMLIVWGGNPAVTNVPNFHYLTEARYRGVKVVTIQPDHGASVIHSDLWVPVNVGTDGAFALSLCQVMVEEGLYKADFIREQTDLPLLVRADGGRLLRERDVKRGGREDAFYVFDEQSQRIIEAPRKTLDLAGIVPALEGEWDTQLASGQKARVRPVFSLLADRLNADCRPGQVADLTGASPNLIQSLAREIAGARGVIGLNTTTFGKFYHGDLIERAIILVFALSGHLGRRGAGYNSLVLLTPDTGLGAWERQGRSMLRSAANADPRYVAWKEDGYTGEMILSEYVKDALAAGALASTALVQYVHGGLMELSDRPGNRDPHLKRPLADYLAESLEKGWQLLIPAREKPPKIMIQWGGNVFRRGKGTEALLRNLLLKLDLIVTVDSRMSSTAMYSDFVLPACGWYERTATNLLSATSCPYIHLNVRAIAPLFDSLSDWTIGVRIARAIERRAKQRGATVYLDRSGKERRFDRVVDVVTAGGLYEEDDEEGLARDAFMNATNREPLGWEEFCERGIAAYTRLGSGVRALGHACDLELGEPIVPLTWHTVKKEPYPTLTRRIQFYLDHDWYLELDEALPIHKDSPPMGGDYPLAMTGGHARWSVHSNSVDDRLMLSLQRGEPAMSMSAADARARGIADGDRVEVFNDAGRFRIQAIVAPGIRPGQVVVYHSWENYQFEGWQHFKSVMASPLNPIELVGKYGHIRPDAVAFSPGMPERGTRVEVKRAW